jgi:nitric oxide reductase large subunit
MDAPLNKKRVKNNRSIPTSLTLIILIIITVAIIFLRHSFRQASNQAQKMSPEPQTPKEKVVRPGGSDPFEPPHFGAANKMPKDSK